MNKTPALQLIEKCFALTNQATRAQRGSHNREALMAEIRRLNIELLSLYKAETNNVDAFMRATRTIENLQGQIRHES